jgi:putative peptidoglycan lipid II flippase
VTFAVRRGFLAFDRAFVGALLKFAVAGVVLAAALWGVAHWAASAFASMTSMRDEVALGLLIVAGAIVYGGTILLLFGPRWLRALVRP